MSTFIGRTFPPGWYLGSVEIRYIDLIREQIDKKFSLENNIIINTTWFWTTEDNINWNLAKEEVKKNKNGKLFLLAFVDPAPQPKDLSKILELFKDYNIYRIGNFEGKYSWHLLSTVWCDRFKKYDDDEITLGDLKYKFLSYSRKPHQHRLELYKKFIDNNLLSDGIATLGSGPNHNFDSTLNENLEDYVEHGHWFKNNDRMYTEHGIPHDIFSLGKLDIWQHHFLNIVNETMPNWELQELMVTEKTLKPIIGLRPFLINGDTRSYQWLQNRGFKIFNHWFPTNNSNPIIETLLWLKTQSKEQIEQMYQDMLPDLLHNRNRFFEFAQEEKLRMENIFDVR